MGYVESTLIQNEKIESKFSVRWWFYIQNIMFCWLVVPLYWLIQLLFTEYGITNKRVITKSGIISRDTDEMKLEKD